MNLHSLWIPAKKPKGTLLLLHGLTGNLRRWDDYRGALSKYNLLLVDLLGHGHSPAADDISEYSTERQARKILSLLNKHRVKKCAILCHSYSFGIALALIQKDPRFTQLVAISPSLATRRLKRYFSFLRLLFPLWKILPHVTKKKKKSYRKFSFLDIKSSIEEIGLKSYLAYLKNAPGIETLHDGKNMKLKTMIIRREKDALCDEELRSALKSRFANLEERTLEGERHLYLEEDGTKIKTILLSTL